MHWFCSRCETETLSVGKVIHSIKMKQDSLDSELSSLKSEFLKQCNITKNELGQLKKNVSESTIELKMH